ncbi:hypothetical protein HN51_015311, partial [Arachis hypogaea]
DFVFAPYGSYWKFMKKVCMLELLGGKMLLQLLHVRQQERKRFLSDLAKKGLASETVDIGGKTHNAYQQRDIDDDDGAELMMPF